MHNQTVNGFKLQRKLGEGGMAEVWIAENGIGKKAAIKIIKKELALMPEVVTRFENEAKVMVALNHANIRQVYDYALIENRPCIVMEYLEGSDLSERLKKGERFSGDKLRDWWNQIVEALQYTHSKGVVHRDIKPSNIFFTVDGKIKLLDFGIAKIKGSITATQTGTRMGTLLYMSPEQVKDSKNIDYRTDIYSLAVTFYHLLAGVAPYDSTKSSDWEIQTKIVMESLHVEKLPDEWKLLLEPYLNKDFQLRPELKAYGVHAHHRPSETPADETTIKKPAQPKAAAPPPTPTPIKPGNKKALYWILGAVALVILVVLLKGIVNSGGSEEKPVADSISEQDSIAAEQKRQQAEADTLGQINNIANKKQNEASADEEKAWKAIQRVNSKSSYENYLIRYPQGKYAAEARKKLVEMDGSTSVNRQRNLNIEWVSIPGGSFMMGSPENENERDDDEWQEKITIRAYKMSRYEITNAQFDAFCEATGYKKPYGLDRSNRPVVNVTWNDAKAFADWTGCRLPTEAEWEYACRAGTTTPFNTGNCLNTSQANYNGDEPYTGCSKGLNRKNELPVGSFAPNAWGLYDMHGNVDEWCNDYYDSYAYRAKNNPKGPSSGNDRVRRGGSHFRPAALCRSACRGRSDPSNTFGDLGFRVALSR
ncbi:MAG: SUMF1/EgtB/PvdO family nonheme iron enzyme [Lentimicrobium sp.]